MECSSKILQKRTGKFINSNISSSSVDLVQTDISEETIDTSISKLVDVILEADQKFIPVKKKPMNLTDISDELKALIALRRSKIRKYKRTHDPNLKNQIKITTGKIEFKREINQKFSNTMTLTKIQGHIVKTSGELPNFLKIVRERSLRFQLTTLN